MPIQYVLRRAGVASVAAPVIVALASLSARAQTPQPDGPLEGLGVWPLVVRPLPGDSASAPALRPYPTFEPVSAAEPIALPQMPQTPQIPPKKEPPKKEEPKKEEPKEEATTPTPEQTPSQDQSAAVGGEGFAGGGSPNMIGDLLGAGNSVSFLYQRSRGNVFLNGTGSTNIINPKVADNNSPIPRDRIAFRYNYFNDALKVVGDSGQAAFSPALGLSQFSQPRFQGTPETRLYDVHDFTFSGEKTFFNGRMSIEMRLPFSATLSHDLDLAIARISSLTTDNDDSPPSVLANTEATPRDTLGNSDVELGNISIILKGLVYQSKCFAFSVGSAFGIPTARPTHIRVTDYLGDFSDNDIEVQRTRDFLINNETYDASPFLAFLWTPTDRFFCQAFTQFDVPLNKSRITYQEYASVNTEPDELQLQPASLITGIKDQLLYQVDVGLGYWVIRRDCGFLTGVAPCLEMHYTTTLDNADIITLPVGLRNFPGLAVVGTNGLPQQEPNPLIGNLRNRVDILNITMGTTFEFAKRATVAAAFTLPLLQGDNRTFDWEFHVQVNYRFGAQTRQTEAQTP